jgi:isopenicillin N synthase-like dioxygenase
VSKSVLIPENMTEKLREEGFLVIELQRATSKKVAGVFAAGSRFFHLPSDEKAANKLPNEFGYRPIGVEYSNSPDHPDLAESFSVCARMSGTVEPESSAARILYRRMLETFDALESIAETIAVRLAETLGGNPIGEKLRSGFRRWSRLQLNYSRPLEIDEPFINEPHEDGDLLTIACATGPGLELKKADGVFSSLTTTPTEALIMPGEIAWLLSGGHVKPAWHCVRPQPHATERMALLFFGDLHPRLCEPWIRNQVNADVDISERVLKSVARFGLQGFGLEE